MDPERDSGVEGRALRRGQTRDSPQPFFVLSRLEVFHPFPVQHRQAC